MARRGDWVPCRGYGLSVDILGNTSEHVVLVGAVDLFDVGSGLPQREVGAVEEANRVLTQRVVGDITISSDDDALVIERIRVGILDNAGAVAFFSNVFIGAGAAADANEPFLFQRVRRVSAGVLHPEPIDHPYWTHIDCRVARRLEQDQALFYSINNVTAGTTVRVVPFLRTWARSTG